MINDCFNFQVISLEWGNFKSQQSQQKGTGQGYNL